VVLLDTRMRAFIATPHALTRGQSSIEEWLARRGFVLASTVNDRTYGTIEIYRLEHDPTAIRG
jgi:hypothetical protein